MWCRSSDWSPPTVRCGSHDSFGNHGTDRRTAARNTPRAAGGLLRRRVYPTRMAAPAVNGLALSDYMRAEQVELDFPGDVGDARLAGLAGGEVTGFLGLAGAGPVRAVPGEGGGGEDLEQERGEREISLLRGEKPRRYPSRRPGH